MRTGFADTLDRVMLEMVLARMSDEKLMPMLEQAWRYRGRQVWNRVAALEAELMGTHQSCLRDERFGWGRPCHHEGPAFDWLRGYTWESIDVAITAKVDEACAWPSDADGDSPEQGA
jgi:hypothetical protein